MNVWNPVEKAVMCFRQALRKDKVGDTEGCGKWLDKAVEAEARAVANGDTVKI